MFPSQDEGRKERREGRTTTRREVDDDNDIDADVDCGDYEDVNGDIDAGCVLTFSSTKL